MFEIRKAKHDDISSINQIYNEAIRNTNATFDIEEKTIDWQKKWFENHGTRYPIIVVEQNGKIVGWASLSKFDEKEAYADSTEISVYIKKEFQRQGIGRKLMKSIIMEGEKSGIHTIIARITKGNDHSVRLHEMFDFKKVGILREIGYKFDKLLDVIIMQKILR